MVGVAGRSKGCKTCKKRRIKCDEQKPECGRCLRAGYKCAGYARDLEFRISTPTSQASGGRPTTTSTRPVAEIVPPEISLVAFKPDMQYAFMLRNFVWSSWGSPWLQHSARGQLGVLSQQACSSFSQVTFGRHHQAKEIDLNGEVLYGLAVGKVRQGLAHPPTPAMSELLVPIMMFLLYSSTQPLTGETQSHVMGLFRLLMMCGPVGFQQRPLRDTFCSCRATLVIVGLLQKRRLFLEEQDWCTVPWALQPHQKSNQDCLIDILAKMPGLLEEQQALQSCFDPGRTQRLIDAASTQLRLLFDWRCRWEAENPNAVVEFERSEINGPTSGNGPPDVQRLLHFSDLTAAVEIELYNATLLCYLGLLYFEMTALQAQAHVREIAMSIPRASTPWSNLPLRLPSQTTVTLRTVAVEIVRTFEYQLHHTQQCPDIVVLYPLFPLGLASKILSKDAAMTRWIQDLLAMSTVTKGYGRGENAFGFGSYVLPTVDERVDDCYTDVQIA